MAQGLRPSLPPISGQSTDIQDEQRGHLGLRPVGQKFFGLHQECSSLTIK